MQQLGCEVGKTSKTFRKDMQISEQQKMVMGGLLERLLSQLPAYSMENDT
jgi:hypothetical protein